MKFFFQAFFRDVSTTSAPLTSLKQNGCYCGREGFLCAGIREDDIANLQLQGSLSTNGARNFKKLFVYAKVKVLGDHQYRRTELDCRIDICRVTKGSHIEHL